MKKDNKEGSVIEKKGFLSLLVRRKNRKSNPVFISILPILSMLFAVWPNALLSTSGAEVAKIGIITLILTGTITFYIRVNEETILNLRLSKTIIVFGYLGSITLLFLLPNPELDSLWLIGGLLISMLIDNKLGLLCNFILAFLLGFSHSLEPQQLIQLLIVCVLLSVLSGAIKNKATVVYAVIIILSINITVAFAINNFSFSKEMNYDYVRSLFNILTVMVLSYIIAFLYQKFIKNEIPTTNPVDDSSLNQSVIAIQELATSDEVMTKGFESELERKIKKQLATSETSRDNGTDCDKTSYEKLCNTDNELMNELREKSEELYLHSLLIGELSERAASIIGANAKLAKAGGLYHEIGKIRSQYYIEEGLRLAKEHSFPEEVAAIIREHNVKYDRPSSVEAAIVMLSDNVVSTIDYIEKTNDNRYTTHKIIENIFQMRLEKGTFDASELNLKDFKLLKEFYQEEFKSKKS